MKSRELHDALLFLSRAADRNPMLLLLAYQAILYGYHPDELGLSKTTFAIGAIEKLIAATRETKCQKINRKTKRHFSTMRGALCNRFHSERAALSETTTLIDSREEELNVDDVRKILVEKIKEIRQNFQCADDDSDISQLYNFNRVEPEVLDYITASIFTDFSRHTKSDVSGFNVFDFAGYVIALISGSSLLFYGRAFILEKFNFVGKEILAWSAGGLAYAIAASLLARFDAEQLHRLAKREGPFIQEETKGTNVLRATALVTAIVSCANNPYLAHQRIPENAWSVYLKTYVIYPCAVVSPFLGNSFLIDTQIKEPLKRLIHARNVKLHQQELYERREDMVHRLLMVKKMIAGMSLTEKDELARHVLYGNEELSEHELCRQVLKSFLEATRDFSNEDIEENTRSCHGQDALKNCFKVVGSTISLIGYSTNVAQGEHSLSWFAGYWIKPYLGSVVSNGFSRVAGLVSGVVSTGINGLIGSLGWWQLINNVFNINPEMLRHPHEYIQNMDKYTLLRNTQNTLIAIAAIINSLPSFEIAKENPMAEEPEDLLTERMSHRFLRMISVLSPYAIFLTAIVLSRFSVMSLRDYIQRKKANFDEYQDIRIDDLSSSEQSKLNNLYNIVLTSMLDLMIGYMRKISLEAFSLIAHSVSDDSDIEENRFSFPQRSRDPNSSFFKLQPINRNGNASSSLLNLAVTNPDFPNSTYPR